MKFPKPAKTPRKHRWVSEVGSAIARCLRCGLAYSPSTKDENCQKKHKFGAVKTTLEGEDRSFPSKLEAKVYAHFKRCQELGQIEGLTRYASVRLSDAKIAYKPDARAIYADIKQQFYIEAKGVEDARFKLIKKLWEVYADGPLEIWKANGRGIYLAETIIPGKGYKKE